MAKASVNSLDKWYIEKANQLGTTRNNMDARLRECGLIQLKIGREILHLASHHLIIEIIA